MRVVWIAFALGVVVLQRQAALPGAVAWTVGAAVLAGCAVLGAWCVRRRRTRAVAACGWMLWALAACVAGFGYAAARAEWRLSDNLPTEWEGRDIVVTGVIRGLPVIDETGARLLFAVESNDAGLARFPPLIRLSWRAYGAAATRDALPDWRAAQRWRFVVRLKRPHAEANPGVRDSEAAWFAAGIRAIGYVSAPRRAALLDARASGWRASIDRVRDALRTRIGEVLGTDAAHRGIVAALAIGEQSGIGEDDWRVLRNTGTSHLVAISGLHVGLVGALAGWLVSMVWRRVRWRGRAATLVLPAPYAAALAALVAAAGYAALAGFNVPAQRAWWMIAGGGIAYLAGRSVPTSAVLCAALGGVLLADPWAVLSAGFWLSFGAVAVILLAVAGWRAVREADEAGMESGAADWRSRLRAWTTRGGRRLAEATRVQYAVTIGLAPLTAAWFAQVSLSGPFGNAFAIPWVSSVVTPVVLAGIALPPPLDAAAFRLAHAALEPMMTLLGHLADWPAGVFWLRMPDWPVLALACVGVAWVLMPRGWPLRWAAPLTWLPLVAPAPDAPPPGGFRMTVLDVGQGAAVLVETARRTLLFDAGPGAESSHAGTRIVAPALRARGISTIDSLVLSHADADHAGGAAAVYAAADVRQLLAGIAPKSRLWRDAQAAGVADRLPCAAGQRWTWDGVAFTMLWPPGGRSAGSSNGQSCVLRIDAGGTSALLTGDIEAGAERRLVADARDALAAQILVVPHHGSRTSSMEPFLDSVGPRVAVFPVGYRNRFGHPHRTVLARYEARGIPLPRTDRDGAVRFDVAPAGGGFGFARYRDERRRYWMDR
ncbi:DNA internalization-related competence protein ComEC/Rec2 [Burkholderia cenocepacia]|uniref:DNA internalization-related competence protein ComEC/Rec2 n=1 Tax=Burkholderia cenocepacia TaxID=95486 RepID=A0ABD4UPV8_9BURK|nr:DNA internalization-related competence protein ComEC/Rec2 [Burkholderia cenocepacia]MCW3700505.1 DNA internalization-related competence protein ComEC/Rec2 [Burkholderia cenocepacia]MCW3704675.1 DNA internalization-related competence protein ComEC/Rec2 [Burkholderia cenocepacia]MCW3716437.1 DNA internalization-related competence protein ComEC/Rec2 [Burkholderia cenocepacia]MCW3720505.1 DNA internalization-related competence protein ComEC/Rec2 [Burkholderia cenocepacia]MCW3729717.1 DNA intern